MSLVEFLSARIDDDSAAAQTDRLRAEVRAKRRLIDLLTYSSAGHRTPPGPEQDAAIRIMAEVYAAHPNYLPEWKL